MKEELLEYVFKSLHEDCLSDLRIPSVLRKYQEFILDIDETAFDLNDWNQFLDYVGCPMREAKTIEQAKAYLSKWLKEK